MLLFDFCCCWSCIATVTISNHFQIAYSILYYFRFSGWKELASELVYFGVHIFGDRSFQACDRLFCILCIPSDFILICLNMFSHFLQIYPCQQASIIVGILVHERELALSWILCNHEYNNFPLNGCPGNFFIALLYYVMDSRGII